MNDRMVESGGVGISVGDGQAVSWQLSRAVLVYESGSSAYATLHEVENRRSGAPCLGAGVPATKQACAALARALGATSTLSGFLPPNLLYLGAQHLIWWRPPAPATLYFDTTKEAADDQQEDRTHADLIGKRVGSTPQPGLLFAVTPGSWYVFALKDPARPQQDTQLWRAPYFNVWASGEVCTGNVRLPETLTPEALDRFERAFFDSQFTHPNVHGRERLTAWPGGSYAFWRDLLDGGPDKPFPLDALVDAKPFPLDALVDAKPFPLDALVDAKLTLQGLVRRLEEDIE